jgi:aminoglycoside 6'-N-acetyltransferase
MSVRSDREACSPSAAAVAALPRIGPQATLRRFRLDDLPAFAAYRADPVVARWQGWSPMTVDAARAFVVEMSTIPLFVRGEWAQLALADSASDALLGDIGLFLSADGRDAEIGITLARAAQGRGVATEGVALALGLVFAATDVERVAGVTDARNGPCIRLLERAGMRRRARRETLFRGEPCVEFVYVVERALPAPGALCPTSPSSSP